MTIVKELCILLVLANLAFGQIPGLGFCPAYNPMPGFDIERYLGKWYEAEKYFTFSEVGSRCVVTDYARGPSGKIYVSNEVTSRVTGYKRILEGIITLSAKSDEGKLNVKYNTNPIPNEQTLIVLETDYDDYAVLWSCSRLGPIYTQNVWVMTRDRLPGGPTLQKAYGTLDKFKINRTFFVKTDQEGCALAASELNAQNGITGISTVPQVLGEEQKNSLLLQTETPSQQNQQKNEIKEGSTTTKPTQIFVTPKHEEADILHNVENKKEHSVAHLTSSPITVVGKKDAVQNDDNTNNVPTNKADDGIYRNVIYKQPVRNNVVLSQ